MKIISWNCGGKFREKFQYIAEFDADIYIIQECENPIDYPSHSYFSFATNYLWTGERNCKGLGVFAKPSIHLQLNDWEKYCLRNFLSVNVNGQFDLVAVWACRPYIEEYYIYQNINLLNYNDSTVIMGDFNSNAIWDKKHDTRTHSAVVQQLQSIGLSSAYHLTHKEQQGEETKHTFYLYRHADKGYHIDHCFTSAKNIQHYQVCDSQNWLDKSDRIPVILEYDDQRKQI